MAETCRPQVKKNREVMPVAPLMKEHRLIERVVAAMKYRQQVLGRDPAGDHCFITAVVGFMREYTDRCHHGKEEDILFRRLAEKSLSVEHKTMLQELLREHEIARGEIALLEKANEEYAQGRQQAIKDINAAMVFLEKLYVHHIEKEDQRFFLPCMKYFSQDEWHRMLDEFSEFDQRFMMEYSKQTVEELETMAGLAAVQRKGKRT